MAAALQSVACSSCFILLLPSSRSIDRRFPQTVCPFRRNQEIHLPKGTHLRVKDPSFVSSTRGRPSRTDRPAGGIRRSRTWGGGELEEWQVFMEDHWYPVSLVEDLDPKLTTPFQLLGRDVVIWFDRNDDQWVVFDDKCPHRLAPLSEGRIDEDGNLQCSYHGWSFDGCGSCTKMPQAPSEGPDARSIRSPGACIVMFGPTSTVGKEPT